MVFLFSVSNLNRKELLEILSEKEYLELTKNLSENQKGESWRDIFTQVKNRLLPLQKNPINLNHSLKSGEYCPACQGRCLYEGLDH